MSLRDLFKLLDLDGNGFVTMDEVNYLGNDSGILAALDLNHDEMVTTEELQTFMGTLKVEFGTTVQAATVLCAVLHNLWLGYGSWCMAGYGS